MGELKETAYLREFETNSQCELMFVLSQQIQGIGLFKEEVRAVRQITDTVESMLQHIVNKIKKSIKTFTEIKADSSDCKVEIPISLINGEAGKPIQGKMVLKNLINSNIGDIRFQIFDQQYIVIINAPLVKEIKLPLILYANFTVQASKLFFLFAEHSSCQFFWFKSKDKENWTKVANTSKYKITEDDIDHYLKLECVPCNNVLTGPSALAISENKVELIGNLPTCPFEERHKFTTKALNNNHFRVVSYNVLSNRYTEGADSFPYCPPKFLAIDYRKQLITKELLGYKADIICLQEVDTSAFTTYYKDVFKNSGYMSFYHKKGNKISEGLACFFNMSRFKKVDDHQIIYNTEIKKKLFAYSWNFVNANPDVRDCFMRQMTSLHITVLKLKTAKKNHCLIVGNTHLFYHPDHELIRILQINVATTYLQSLRQHYCQKNSVEVILCGDFNSIPTSAVCDYVSNGKLDKNHTIFQNTKHRPNLFHSFQFESACGAPKYTNYTRDFKNCLDYIFIEKTKMKVNKVIPFPRDEDLHMYEGCPNEVYPSDHLALVVDLEIIAQGLNSNQLHSAPTSKLPAP